MACKMLSALMSVRTYQNQCLVQVPVLHTCVDELALGVQVVEGQKKVLQTALQERIGEAPARISPEEVLPAVPHGSLDEALMVASGTVNGEHVQSSPDMPVSRMGRVCLVDSLVGPKLIFACLSMLARENLQGDIIVLSNSLCYLISARLGGLNMQEVPGEPNRRDCPKP